LGTHCLEKSSLQPAGSFGQQETKVIFDKGQIDINIWRREFKEELGLVCIKAKPSRQTPLNLWRDSYNIRDGFFCLGLVAL
jgi:hypothetical protein